MKRVLATLLVTSIGFACAYGHGKEGDPKHEWHEIMEELEEFQYGTLKNAATDLSKADLSAIATTASQVAGQIRKYGEAAMPGDAEFARLAAATAKWYDDVAMAAGSGATELGAALARYGTIENDVCTKCHDAYQSKW